MKYIVEGPALAKLLQENRIRVLRGEITFTPLTIGEEAPTIGEEAPTIGEEAPTIGEEAPTIGEEAPTIGEEDDKSADVSDEKEVAVTDCKKPKKGKK